MDNGLDNTTPETVEENPVVLKVVQTPDSGCPELALAGTDGSDERQVENDQKPLPQQVLVNLCQQMAEADEVAEEGFEACIEFRGKTYILGFAGDSRGIISAKPK